jgi:hypothetical protein
MAREKQNRKSVLLRIKPDLWDHIARLADAEFRSVNAQMEYMLEQSVKKDRKTDKGNKPRLEE